MTKIPDGVVVKINVHNNPLPQEIMDCVHDISIHDVSEGQDTASFKVWNNDQQWSRRRAFSMGMPVTISVGITGHKIDKLFDGQINSIEKESNPECLTIGCTVLATHKPEYRAPDLTSHTNTTAQKVIEDSYKKMNMSVKVNLNHPDSLISLNTPGNFFPSELKTTLECVRGIVENRIGARIAAKKKEEVTVHEHPSRQSAPVSSRSFTWGTDIFFTGLQTKSVAHDETPPTIESSTSVQNQKTPKETLKKIKIDTSMINVPPQNAGESNASYWERLKKETGYVSGGPLKINLGTNYRSESTTDAEQAAKATASKIGEKSVEGTLKLNMTDPVRAMQWITISGRYEENGLYYVESVTHFITGSYKQTVELSNKRKEKK